MLRYSIPVLLGAFILITSCKSETKLSDSEQIETNIRNYFFLTDSINVSVDVADTLFVADVEELLETVEQNLNLIDRDLDTLSERIDQVSYQKLTYEKEADASIFFRKINYQDSVEQANTKILELQLQQVKLEQRWLATKQTKRILLHLKRSIWADIAGFNVLVEYPLDGEMMQFDLLLDANFTVID